VKIANFGKKHDFCDFSSFLAFFAYFQALISAANINQNATCYNTLEMVECEQQYSGQFIVIYDTCLKLFAKKTYRGSWYKNWWFSKHYFEQLKLFNWKNIGTTKTMNLSEHFHILHISNQAI
jgi:hypothetical protein